MPRSLRSNAEASRDDLRRLFGEVDDEVVLEILKLAPTAEELEEVSAWLAGQGDIPSRAGHPQSAKVGAIVEILSADEDAEEARRP
jgi:hypothetical protein